MKTLLNYLIRAIVLSMLLNAGNAIIAQQTEVSWTTRTLRGSGGVPIRGEIGTILVPSRHANPTGPKLELSFVRFRSDHPRPRPTIFFLAGGPGGSGIELSALIATHPQLRLLELADVVGIDQRGTGLSRPNLMEPEFVHQLPWEQPADRADYLAAFGQCVRECVAHCQRHQIDIGAFNTMESSHDLDLVRQSLGLDKIVLFGSSYGSHLGLAYLKEYWKHVDRAVLTKVEGLDQTWKYPHSMQKVLERLSIECCQNSEYSQRLPDLQTTIAELCETLRTERVQVTIQDADQIDRVIILSEYELRMATASWIAESDGITQLPLRLVEFLDGDWRALAKFAQEQRRVSFQAMPLFMDCASGASRERIEQIEQERLDPRNVLQDGLTAPFFLESCRSCGAIDLGDSYRTGSNCSVPILFVSGTLDVRTPPENVAAILANYPQAAHVVVHNAGHDSRELMSIEYRRLLQSFLRGATVKSTEFILPPVIFEASQKIDFPSK